MRFHKKEILQESKEDINKLVDFIGQDHADEFLAIRNKLKAPENDIYYWIKKSPRDFLNFLKDYKSKSEKTREEKTKGAKLLGRKGNTKLYKITDYAAAKYYGKGTKWCISGNYPGVENKGEEYFSRYIDEVDLDDGYYFLFDDNNKYAILKTKNGQIQSIWDAVDNTLVLSKFIETVSDNAKELFKEHIFNYENTKITTFLYEGQLRSEIPDYVRKIEFARTINRIKVGAFDNLHELQELFIPSWVKSAYSEFCSMCYSLKEVYIGAGLTDPDLAYNPFHGCENLKTLEVSPDNPLYTSKDNVLFTKNEQTLIRCPQGKEGTYRIPDTVKKLKKDAFLFCNKITEIWVPDGITEIPDYCFCGCYALKIIHLPKTIMNIDRYAFFDCYSLKKIEWAGSVDNTYSINIDPQGNDLLAEDDIEIIHLGGGEMYESLQQLKESLVEIHDELNPKIWTEDNQLRPEIANKCEEITTQFLKGLADNEIPATVLDAWIVGSNASYNYTEHSDLDLHIIVNTEATSKCPELLSKLYDFYRNNFNKKYDISLHDIQVELYLEDIHASTITNGIYSLFQSKWLKEPKPLIGVAEVDISDMLPGYEKLYNDVLAGNYDPSQLIDDLYLLRKTSIATDGEFGKGNLVFKEFRNKGYIDKLRELAVEKTSKELSLENYQKGE